MHTLLLGVVGSTAYGLAGPDSDVDRLGIYAVPTIEFHGLHPPTDKTSTVVRNQPSDVTLHEVGKFARLCLGGNPTMTELLWLENYEVTTELGREATTIRSAFLSAKRVREAYYGYASAQFKKLRDTGQFASKQRARASKHARHMLRLLDQGLQLYATGHLTIRLDDPDWYREEGNLLAGYPDQAVRVLADAEEKFNAVTSPLPAEPNIERVTQWLNRVRARFLESPE